ncbi:MAG: CsbD family protein [Streptosporangiaceae bacterium]
MSAEDTAKNTAEQATGKVKEGAGKVTGNEALEAEGRGDQAKGSIKQAFERVEDAFKK